MIAKEKELTQFHEKLSDYEKDCVKQDILRGMDWGDAIRLMMCRKENKNGKL